MSLLDTVRTLRPNPDPEPVYRLWSSLSIVEALPPRWVPELAKRREAHGG